MNMPLNIDWQQILLHLLNFVILAGGLYLLLYKPVRDFMEKRTEYFRSMEQDARQKTASAGKLKAEYEAQLQRAGEEAEQQRLAAKKKSEEACAGELQAAQRQAEKIVSDARQQAERERARILAEAQREIVDMAAMATEKLLMEKTAASAYDQFLDAAKEEAQHA